MSDPKLIDAMKRVRKIIEKDDLAAVVILCNKTQKFELAMRTDPSWSIVKGAMPHIRMVSQLTDYKGDTEAQMADINSTISMVKGFFEIMASNGLAMNELLGILDIKFPNDDIPLHDDTDEGSIKYPPPEGSH